MKFDYLLLSFLIGAILLAPAAFAYQSDGPTGMTSFVLGIVSLVSDFLNKIFAAPNLVVSDAKFSGDDLQIIISNTGKVGATFPISNIEVSPNEDGASSKFMCKSSGDYCVDNPASSLSCSASGGRCTVRGARTGLGQCSCVFKPKTTGSQLVTVNTGQSTTLTIKNVGAPKARTEYYLKILGSGNIKEYITTKIFGGGSPSTSSTATTIPPTTTTVTTNSQQGNQNAPGGQPDLTVSITGFSNNGKTTSMNVNNIGNSNSAGVTVRAEYKQPPGYVIDRCFVNQTSAISAGSSISVSCSVSVPAGDYTVFATVDTTNQVAESDENNNQAQNPVTVS